MKLMNYGFVWCTVFGMVISASPGALRNLNRKVNLLKKSFKRELESQKETFQREIDDLKYEVLDLKTELHIEKTKTERLLGLLNGTDFAGVAVVTESLDQIERKGSAKGSQPTDSGIIQEHTRQLRQLNESIESHEAKISDNKKAIQVAKKLRKEMAVCKRLHQAFQEEKKHNQQMMVERAMKRESDRKLDAGVTEMRNKLEVVSKQVENNTDDIEMLRSDLVDQDQIYDIFNATIRKQSMLSLEMSGDVQAIQQKWTMADAAIAEIIENITALQISIDNVVKDTLEVGQRMNDTKFISDKISQHGRCLEAIRAGGEATAELLYVGVRVKRGKDWEWDDQDGGGEGKVTVIPDDMKDDWVSVLWDNDHSNNYRMGVDDAYDLLIVEEKFDFSRCK